MKFIIFLFIEVFSILSSLYITLFFNEEMLNDDGLLDSEGKVAVLWIVTVLFGWCPLTTAFLLCLIGESFKK